MRSLHEKHPRNAPNAWGRYVFCWVERFEVEVSDVGREIPHMGGFNRPSHFIRHHDVGRVLERMSDDHGWVCWGFLSQHTAQQVLAVGRE